MPDVEASSGQAPVSAESKRSAQVFNAQAISAFFAMLGTGCGIAFMLLFGESKAARFELNSKIDFLTLVFQLEQTLAIHRDLQVVQS